MGLILNIETATTVCSVSIARDGKLLAFVEQDGDYSHSENLTLFIEQCCKKADVTLSEIEAVAVSKGPGSYTGLRIGTSTAKGLCYALNIPLIAINTLQHMAYSVSENKSFKNIDADTWYCPMIDARRMEVYCAIYDVQNKEQQATSAEIIDEYSFAEILEKRKLLFFGNGSEKCKLALEKNENAIFIDQIKTSAKNMVHLSEISFSKKSFEDLAYFEPFYLKDFIAGKASIKK